MMECYIEVFGWLCLKVWKDRWLVIYMMNIVGSEAMKTIACQCVWWKTINKDINSWSKRCERHCKAKSHVKSQWNPWPEETEKWHRVLVHADIVGTFEDGRYALIIVDAYTKWPEVHIMTSTTSSEVKKRWRRKLLQEGVSVILVTDNGLKFVSK